MKKIIRISDFKDTTIKTPFEQMRANAIINATQDAAGLSMINFNITTFLAKHRHEDAYFILSLWAVKPISTQTEKFMQRPEAGQDALKKRAEILMMHFQKRNDVTDAFIETALSHMNSSIQEKTQIFLDNKNIARSA